MLIQNLVLAAVENNEVAHSVLQGLLSQAGGVNSTVANIAMVALMVVIFYFLLIRPQSKQAKEHKAMLSSLKKGDSVVIGGGVLGRIHQVAEKTVMVEVAQGVRLRVLLNSITNKAPEGLVDEEPKGDKS